jgi:hypothetical protein
MANFSQNDHQMILVGKDVAITASPGSPNGLADGEIRCFTPGGTVIAEGTIANDEFVVVLGRGSNDTPLVSPKIKKDWVKRISKKDYTAPTAQLDYVGYNGTSGSIVTNNNTVYRASIALEESPTTNHGGVYIKDMVYSSDSSATQAEIAIGLAGSGVGNFSREYDKSISFKAICNSAVTAANDFVNNITVVNGSKVVSVATAITWGAGATTLAIGDFVRMGSNGAGTALTDDVYKVTAVDTTNLNFTVDRPVQITSQVLTAASSDAEVIAAATGAAADWGVSLTGLTLDFKLGKIDNAVAKWNLSLDADSFGATTLTNSTTATPGSGSYNQVAELEHFLNGNNGENFRTGEPNIYSYTKMAQSSETYDLIVIEFEKGRTDSLGYVNSPQSLIIAVPAADTNGAWYEGSSGTADDTTDVLEDLLEGVPAYTTQNNFDGSALTTDDLIAG